MNIKADIVLELFLSSDRNRHVFSLTVAQIGNQYEVTARRHIADMAPIFFDGETVVGRWDRFDHAYETIRALCRNVGASSFTVKV